jgi:hypothetical protein
MSATGHSQFSASSAYRLLTCPGSFDLAKRVDTGARRATIFSAEGTLAHSVSEAALFAGTDPAYIIGRTFEADGFEFTPDEDFVEGVQTYVDFIRGLEALGYIVVLETRVSPMIHWEGLGDLGLELFGTADCIAFHPTSRKLLIVDLKFGKGIAVEVANNSQFLYYGAGALSLPLLNYMLESHGHKRLPDGWTPTEIETIVVQPRAFHPDGPIRRATYSYADVVDWARTTLYQGVERAINDNGQTLAPGEHCRFCPAIAHCPAQAQLTRDQAKLAFQNAPGTNVALANPGDPSQPPTQAQQLAALPASHISDTELSAMLDTISILKPYFAALEGLALDRLKQASNRPGLNWKIVPTRTRRIWADGDEQALIAEMARRGADPMKIADLVVPTPAQLERRLGKREFKIITDGLVKQSTPGTTLAPEGDPRTRVQQGRSAKEAFGITSP